jgi:hypothetical protein
MKTIDLNGSNQEIAEKLVHRVFASANPQAAAINLIHSMIDHPWLDAEMHDNLIRAAATCLDLQVESSA